MANGDAAAAAGLAVFSSTQDHGLGYDNDNIRGDELAAHIVDGGHPWSKISNKPPAFPPASHTHPWNQVTDRPSTFPTASNQIGDSTVAGRDVLTAASYAAIRGLLASAVGQDLMTATSPAAARSAINAASTADVGTADTVSFAAYGRSVSGSGQYSMWMDSSLNIGRNPSSIRYKEDVAAHDVDTAAVMKLQPVTYRRKNDRTGTYEYGLIAEDVLEAGLPELVVYYDDQVDGVRYDLVALTLLSVVKDQAAALAALTDRVAQLEGAGTNPEEG